MTNLKPYVLAIETKGSYRGIIDATSEADAVQRAFSVWTTQNHDFEQFDEELISAVAEVQP